MIMANMFIYLLFQYTSEALFRSEQYALVDNACREYLFVTEFFMVRGTQAQDLFNQIMGKTLTLMIVTFLKPNIFIWIYFLVYFFFRKTLKLTCKIASTLLQCFYAFNLYFGTS